MDWDLSGWTPGRNLLPHECGVPYGPSIPSEGSNRITYFELREVIAKTLNGREEAQKAQKNSFFSGVL
jgi:hypothetical protein